MSPKVERCMRCERRGRGAMTDWNVVLQAGVVVGQLCPGCQTPEESLEADVNEATLNYFVLPDGRFAGRPKGSS